MKPEVLDHPAVLFGAWIKEKRRETGVVARAFAGSIDLSPAEYAEVESGIIDWITEKQEIKIALLLGFDDLNQVEFNRLLSLAREARALTFSDVFSQAELAPTRCCTVDGKQIDESTRQKIIEAVFTPLCRSI